MSPPQSNAHIASGQYSPSTISNSSSAGTSTAVSCFAAAPSAAQTSAALAASPNVRSSFNPSTSEDLGLGYLAFDSTGNNTGANTYQANTSLFIDPAHLQQSEQHLLFGLLDVSSHDAAGLTSLRFHLYSTQGGPSYKDITFTSFTAAGTGANTFFTDNTLDLGALNSLHTIFGKIDLGLTIDAVTTTPNNALAFDFIVANSTLNSNPIPEPASLSLLATAALPLLLRRRRTAGRPLMNGTRI